MPCKVMPDNLTIMLPKGVICVGRIQIYESMQKNESKRRILQPDKILSTLSLSHWKMSHCKIRRELFHSGLGIWAIKCQLHFKTFHPSVYQESLYILINFRSMGPLGKKRGASAPTFCQPLMSKDKWSKDNTSSNFPVPYFSSIPHFIFWSTMPVYRR